jgi:hypothetical protein
MLVKLSSPLLWDSPRKGLKEERPGDNFSPDHLIFPSLTARRSLV